MNELRTELSLEAPAERIWELLTDLKLYPQWNPLFQRATGKMSVGEKLELEVHLPDIDPFIVSPKIQSVEIRSGFCWKHTVLSVGFFTWKYCAELEILAPDRLKFIQRSSFGGILGPLFSLGMKTSVMDGLIRMNEAMRRWGEKGNIQCLRC